MLLDVLERRRKRAGQFQRQQVRGGRSNERVRPGARTAPVLGRTHRVRRRCAHNFVMQTFAKPTICDVCRKLLRYATYASVDAVGPICPPVEFLTITSRARIGTGPADPAAAADTSNLRNEKFYMFTLHISVREREMNKKNTQVEKCKHCDQLILGKITLMPPDIRF